MSGILWKLYIEDDVENFRRITNASAGGHVHASKGSAGIAQSPGPSSLRKGSKAMTNTVLTRAELNARDHAGLTLLHRVASSAAQNAAEFALALIEHHQIDLYIQDLESGWTALHRALYFGNVTIAHAIIERDTRDAGGLTGGKVGLSVIKIKDKEGNSPFDVYNAAIARRSVQHRIYQEESDDDDFHEDDGEQLTAGNKIPDQASLYGDELYAFGSNKNFSLGFGDQDDRQHPEKIYLKRPDHLLFRFYREHLERNPPEHEVKTPKSISDLPTKIQYTPIVIQDVVLSKLHSAVLTNDPESNLYMCGYGKGGRLGTGDEQTRFNFVSIDQGGLAGKRIAAVALGQNHTLAVSSEGEIFSWGSNTWSQLGYTLPRPTLKDDEPICSTPRQIFGSLKRECIAGVAASAIHSVAHTATSLFCWGKNEGQLGLMDSDSGSLEAQSVPRKVAASLFKSSIVMVSAIERATTCLLANHTVVVFTNYGYNIVKFPLYESFTNYHLQSNALITRYDGGNNNIVKIESGGDTIAAISSRGDLYTVNVRKADPNSAATSTTNPAKIKGALSQPQRVWSLRKGNWDGVRSVGVAENGSVIVCTQAGAVWRRVKRAKIKDAFTSTGDFKGKDFKFQRVSGLSNVAAIRSTTFGAFAAIRKDCDITKTQVAVADQTLWDDLGPLLSIRDLKASKWPEADEDTESPRFWTPALPVDLFGPLKKAILTSPDIETDVARLLLDQDSRRKGYDVEIKTSSSDVAIPAHAFILASRSAVLKDVLSECRRSGSSCVSEVLIAQTDTTNSRGIVKIVFQGLDFITLVNLVIYLYTDTVVDVWHFARQSPKMAFRYRQVRVELMKTASQLKMIKLESAVRLMIEPDRCLNSDMLSTISQDSYFDDGDTIIELSGAEMLVHSALVCQRCPFFDGLFNGRSGGQWLAARRQNDTDHVRVDLKHISPETFEIVLRYIYADAGPELFDDVVSTDIDEFSDLVVDVLGVANELMMDRLSQVCQQVLGQFVTTRNVAQILNVVAPYSIQELKDAGLEYMCLQLESLLENHLLNDLDEDLLLELDEVVKANQLNCLPFAKSGRAELMLHERYPELAQDIDEERHRRARDIAFRATLKDDEHRVSSSFRSTRFGSLDEGTANSPCKNKTRRKSKVSRNAPFSPNIRPKDSVADLMFEMDDDDGTPLPSNGPSPSPLQPVQLDTTTPAEAPFPNRTPSDALLAPRLLNDLENLGAINDYGSPSSSKWSSPVVSSSKLGMREIMAQASATRISNLSASLSAQKAEDDAAKKAAVPKLSQKERKKQQQQALQQGRTPSPKALPKLDEKVSSPWQVATGSRTNLKDLLHAEVKPVPLGLSQLNDTPGPAKIRRTASPDTRFAGQRKHDSFPKPQHSASPASSKPIPLIPHSKSYTTPTARAEPSLLLSMSDIIGQQKREQEVIKEAVAKRSLQEIQEEQAFQEWWDQEMRRTQEGEARAAVASTKAAGAGGEGRPKHISSSRGRGKGRTDASAGRGGRGRGKNAKVVSGI